MYNVIAHGLHNEITDLLTDLGSVLTRAEMMNIGKEIIYPKLGFWNYKICLNEETLHKIISALQEKHEEVFGKQLPDINIDKCSKLIQGE